MSEVGRNCVPAGPLTPVRPTPILPIASEGAIGSSIGMSRSMRIHGHQFWRNMRSARRIPWEIGRNGKPERHSPTRKPAALHVILERHVAGCLPRQRLDSHRQQLTRKFLGTRRHS